MSWDFKVAPEPPIFIDATRSSHSAIQTFCSCYQSCSFADFDLSHAIPVNQIAYRTVDLEFRLMRHVETFILKIDDHEVQRVVASFDHPFYVGRCKGCCRVYVSPRSTS